MGIWASQISGGGGSGDMETSVYDPASKAEQVLTISDESDYALLDGASGGQTVIGGTDASDALELNSTSNATKGNIIFGDGADQMFYSEALAALAVGRDSHQNVVNGSTFTGKLATHVDDGETSTAGVGVERAEDSSAGFGATLYGGRSRGTLAARTVVQDDDSLFRLIAVGRDGTDFALAGSIEFEVDGTPGSDDMPCRIVFKTSPDGSQTPAEAMRISQDNAVLLAGTLKFTAGGAVNEFSTDGTLAGDSDSAVPTEKAVKTYSDTNFAPTKMNEIVQAATDTLTAAEVSSTVINNYGQSAANTQTLPAAAEGYNGICVIGTAGAGAFHLKAGASDKIYLDGTALDNGDKVSLATPVVGDYFTFWTFQTGASTYDWIVTTGSGTLTDGGA